MNIFSALFGIFRKNGLVTTIKEGKALTGFAISAVLFSLLGGVLYGFATGIGLGTETAIKDAIKIGLIIILVLPLSIPIFWIVFRLLGREEPLKHITSIPLAFVSSTLITMAVTAPIVFMISILVGYSPDAVYIHVVIVDLAVLVGLYVAGTFAYHSFTDHKRLVIPNVIGFIMTGVIAIVLLNFFSPFLEPSTTFSQGTDRLLNGLGIGVAEKVDQSLTAATAADHVTYGFQTTNQNGDLVQDYTITRLGDNYYIQVHRHAVPGEPIKNDQRIWIFGGRAYTDFDNGRVVEESSEVLGSYLDNALPPSVFTIPSEFDMANWRGLERDDEFIITGTTPELDQASLVLNASTGRLIDFTLGSAESGLFAETRVLHISPTELDLASLETTFNQAIVAGSVDRSIASMQDFYQDQFFFVVMYPQNWNARAWSDASQSIKFNADCVSSANCPTLKAGVFDLIEDKTITHYAQDLADSLDIQPDYREVDTNFTTFDGQTVGVVEYLFDELEDGEIKTTRHIEYIFEGSLYRYHMNFSTPLNDFATYQDLFEEMAELFVYLK